VPLRAGDELCPAALLAFVETLGNDPRAECAYADFDRVDDRGVPGSPIFKPGWDPELLRWPGYLGRASAFRRNVVAPAADGEMRWNEIARACGIPHVLCHTRTQPAADAWPAAPPPSEWPRVTAIVPTRDGGAMLRRCIDSLLSAATAYPHLEIVVVDNQSVRAETLEYLRQLSGSGRARVTRFDRPFHYAAMNNEAVRSVSGGIVLLLNDDVEALSPGWLHEMVSHAVRPEVGAVGARLVYPNGSLQHAGLVTGLFGMVGHVCRGMAAEPRAWLRTHARTVSAVTGAALAMRRDLYAELGGLDEQFAVAFNDVDLCLRAARAGYRTVYTPRATLVHRESRTRGRDDTPEKRARLSREIAALRARWGSRLDDDPHYSPNLSLWSDRMRLAWPPRTPRLWE